MFTRKKPDELEYDPLVALFLKRKNRFGEKREPMDKDGKNRINLTIRGYTKISRDGGVGKADGRSIGKAGIQIAVLVSSVNLQIMPPRK